MGLLDLLKKAVDASSAISSVQSMTSGLTGASATQNPLQNIAQTVTRAMSATGLTARGVTLPSLPTTLGELQALPAANLTDEHAVAALTVAVLCNFEHNAAETYRMMDFLRGPRPLNDMDKRFISDRLSGRMYIIRSFLKGTSPENNYQPSTPFTVEVSEDGNSRLEKDYVKLIMRSSGADSPRPIKLRRKPSTGQWFVWETPFLSDIRQPQDSDPWA